MKKYIPLALFLMVLSLGGYAEEPRRFVEFGIDAGAGVANDLIGAEDLLKKQIEINLDDIRNEVKDGGLKLNVDAAGAVFFHFESKQLWGFGLSADAEGGVFANVPKQIFTILADGNKENHSVSGDFITAYGGVFADVEVDAHLTLFKKLKLGLAPALYVPIIYVPKSSIRYNLEAEDNLKFHTDGEIKVYSPFSFDSSEGNVLDGAGFDLSLYAEYDLFPLLDIGADITHIPVVPSTLKHEMRLSTDFEVDGSQLIKDGELDIPDDMIKTEYFEDASKTVMRPLRFDFYANIKPLSFLRIRPNIGFTVLTPSEEPYFNAGLDLRLNVARLLFFHLGTGYEETLWKHRAALAINLRVFELDIEAGLRSQEFIDSFQLHGFNLAVGVRFGY